MMRTDRSARTDTRLLNTFWADEPVRQVLPNGLTLLVKPDHRHALVSVQVWVKTGSIHEGSFLGAGLSHFLEHMLFQGTGRRPASAIATEVQAHGGSINAYTTFDRTVYYIDLPAEHVAVALDVLADMVFHSSLAPEAVAKERDVILREIDMVQDEPDQRLAEALFATTFREHPYRHPIIGYRDVFAAVTRDDLAAYYHARYVPNNMVVVVAGDVMPDMARDLVAVSFGSSPRARLAPVIVPDEPRQLAPRVWERFEAVEISRVGLAWQIPGLAHADTPALDALALILGGGDSSVLWQRVREQAGLVHTIDASCWNPGTSGLFLVSFNCDAAKRAKAELVVERELARLVRTGITPAQLRKAVRQMVVGEINTRKTVSGQASRLGMAEVVVGDLQFSRNYFERLAQLTTKDVRRVLRHYLVPEHRTCVASNPRANGAAPDRRIPAKSQAKDPGLLEPLVLPNGARLILQPERSLPNLHLRLCCLGGPCHEPQDRRGATALMATLLTKDTKDYSAAEVAGRIEEVGGVFHSFAGNNSFGLALEVLPTDIDRAFEVLEAALLRPTFRPATVALERAAQLAALQEEKDDVVVYGRRLLRQRFFGAHPLAVAHTGNEAGVAAVVPGDLVALHRRLMVASNTVLSVAGDFSPRDLAAKSKALLRRLRNGSVERLDGGSVASAQPGDGVEQQPRQQAVLFEAYPAPVLRAPDFYVGEVLDEIFSGVAARLFLRVRDELGLAYFVRSSRVIGLNAAMFYLYAGTAPGSEAAVYAEFEAEIKRIGQGGVSADELGRCQTRLKAGRRMSLQTNASKAMQAGLNALYGLPADDWRRYDAHVDAVTVDDLAAFTARYFAPGHRTRLTLRP